MVTFFKTLDVTYSVRESKYNHLKFNMLIQTGRGDGMSESELYKELGTLTNDRNRWEECIPFVSSLLAHESIKIQAKALWLLGEMGLAYPYLIEEAVPGILRSIAEISPPEIPPI